MTLYEIILIQEQSLCPSIGWGIIGIEKGLTTLPFHTDFLDFVINRAGSEMALPLSFLSIGNLHPAKYILVVHS